MTSRAQICPICHGSGRITAFHYPERMKESGIGNPNQLMRCHGCGGNGWVEVRH